VNLVSRQLTFEFCRLQMKYRKHRVRFSEKRRRLRQASVGMNGAELLLALSVEQRFRRATSWGPLLASFLSMVDVSLSSSRLSFLSYHSLPTKLNGGVSTELKVRCAYLCSTISLSHMSDDSPKNQNLIMYGSCNTIRANRHRHGWRFSAYS
jgi:hypothetical protein